MGDPQAIAILTRTLTDHRKGFFADEEGFVRCSCKAWVKPEDFPRHQAKAILQSSAAALVSAVEVQNSFAEAWDRGYDASTKDVCDVAMYGSDRRTPNPYRVEEGVNR